MKSPLGTPSVEIVTDKNAFDVVTEIVNHTDQEEPFFVTDLADIVYKYKLWKLKMPRIEPFYAVKCNEAPAVLHLLAALGTGFDCASKAEIESVLSIGVESSRIIYANPCKTSAYIKYAASVGVDLMTFDNEMELPKVKVRHPNAKLVIRIRVDDSSAICQLGQKFGCNIEEVPHLLGVAKQLDLNVVGVSFHVGSGCQDASAYRTAIASCRHVFDIAADIGYNMELLDIGGGFPGTKGPFISFEEISAVVNQALDEHFPPECGVRIIAEPGRYFVASAFTLCTNIIAKREVISEDTNEPTCMYYVNDGVYGSFNCLIFDHAEVQPIPLIDSENRPIKKSSLWGPTCDSMDRILETCHLPLMNVGEWLMFENMGAYTICAASTFNGFQKPVMKCILPVHVLTYLQQLPTWSNLLEAFGDEVLDFSNANISTDCENITNGNDICLLPHPESVSA
ncbi:ornithine decarboxylase-like [Stegodyphus dumicola]|uniref:ornithine decarboxylase-like n=1 Tax=Stegodyphus dumicola TaxID=202533 RepID=UPI0015A88CA5|nr:ornithine decarboxylase-like [Stegodyphus dumicola]XP_035213019.1 ornithine decarboxylase-like [Stegodyphus dumicola]